MTLDPQQLEAVQTESSMALVLAGAGSGKTRVLVERIAHLIEEKHVSATEIVAFTFTRKAAGEMRERLEARLGSAAHGLTVGTMHALALNLLRRFGELSGLRPDNITVYSQWEESFLLREVAAEIGALRGKTWKIPKHLVDEMFQACYANGIAPHENHEAYNLFHAFFSRCRENNALTYGGLLLGLKGLLPKIEQYLQWEHILVDETQDLDSLQWDCFLSLKNRLKASLFCVGDVDQCLYAFRGADPYFLVENQDRFDIYRLESNYRSGSGIVVAANNLIAHNENRIPKTMRATVESVLDVHVWPGMDSAAIAEECTDLVFTDPSSIAVLARTHRLLAKLAQELEARGVPHVYIGKKAALTNSEPFRRFHAFLKLLVNPYDNFAFMLIKDLIGLTNEEYGRVRLKAVEEGKSHLQAWQETAEGMYAEFFRTVMFRESLLHSQMEIGTWAKEWGWELDTVKDIDRLILSCPTANNGGSIKAYLDWLATYDIQDEIEEKEAEGVKLMTVHAAKGLEWPMVVVAACNEGILPSKRATDQDDIEAERRLMYVAMTRARDNLILAVRPEIKEDRAGRKHHTPVSRFVAEAGV